MDRNTPAATKNVPVCPCSSFTRMLAPLARSVGSSGSVWMEHRLSSPASTRQANERSSEQSGRLQACFINANGQRPTSTCHGPPGGSKGTSHHPARAQRDGELLVRRVRVPHNQLSILRGADKLPAVSSPVHGVYLRHVSSQGLAHTQSYATNGVNAARFLRGGRERRERRRVAGWCRIAMVP